MAMFVILWMSVLPAGWSTVRYAIVVRLEPGPLTVRDDGTTGSRAQMKNRNSVDISVT
jgi:hypothetical protein